jgi:hypothetical protein
MGDPGKAEEARKNERRCNKRNSEKQRKAGDAKTEGGL